MSRLTCDLSGVTYVLNSDTLAPTIRTFCVRNHLHRDELRRGAERLAPAVGIGLRGRVDGEPELRVKVLNVRQDPYFQLSYGRERPGDGLVYLSVLLRYEALANGADYNPYDWQVFVDDEAYGGKAFVIGGPEPDLSSGNLPKGRKVKGWVTFEVPPKGKVLLAYGSRFSFDDSAPPFEIVVRKK